MKKINKVDINKALSLVLVVFIVFSVLSFSNVNAFASEEKKLEDEIDKRDANSSEEIKGEDINNIFGEKNIYTWKMLYSLDEGDDFVYVEFEKGGYAVFSSKTKEMMEYSLQGTLPYSDSSKKEYYAGPNNYFSKKDSTFFDLTSNEIVNITTAEASAFCQSIRSEIAKKEFVKSDESANEKSIFDEIKNILDGRSTFDSNTNLDSAPDLDTDNLITPTIGTGKLIANYQYFVINPIHGENVEGNIYGDGNSGTCASVATQLLLGYHNYFNYRELIDDRYLNGYSDITNTIFSPENNPNYCTDPMLMTRETTGTRSEPSGENSYYVKVIDALMEPNTSGVPFDEIDNGLESLLDEKLSQNEYIIDCDVLYGYVPISSTPIKTEIDAGRPILISLGSNLGASFDHTVVGYGYQYYTYPNGEGTYDGYIVHFGWRTTPQVWINALWCKGYLSLQINHAHSYYLVGTITGTNRAEYKCSTCSHRTDAAINMSTNERYAERVATIPQNGYRYKDYYVTFTKEGYKLFQTFGSNDTVMYLYDDEYNLLKHNDDAGDGRNALFSYNVEASKVYILRVKFYSSTLNGEIKLGITPSVSASSTATYEDIWNYTGTNAPYAFATSQYTTTVMTFTPTESGTYRFDLTYVGETQVDTYLYLIDPTSTSACLYNDDGGGNLQSRITASLTADRTYFLIASPYHLTNQRAFLYLSVEKIAG